VTTIAQLLSKVEKDYAEFASDVSQLERDVSSFPARSGEKGEENEAASAEEAGHGGVVGLDDEEVTTWRKRRTHDLIRVTGQTPDTSSRQRPAAAVTGVKSLDGGENIGVDVPLRGNNKERRLEMGKGSFLDGSAI
jgi:hypothetical protein